MKPMRSTLILTAKSGDLVYMGIKPLVWHKGGPFEQDAGLTPWVSVGKPDRDRNNFVWIGLPTRRHFSGCFGARRGRPP
jgi:hypothetical protein